MTLSVPDMESEQLSSPSLLLAMPLIESLASAPHRSAALMRLVDALATLCPKASVRAGMGNVRLTRFVDHRLGWLGPESSLRQNAEMTWANAKGWQKVDPSAGEPNRAFVRRVDGSIQIVLPSPEGTRCCVVWIDGPLGEIEWLPSMAIAIGAVLWSRPFCGLPPLGLGATRRGARLGIVAFVAILVIALWPVAYRVACTARVETTGARFVVTPFEAILLKADVRPGDAVAAGEALLMLDGRPLRLERESLAAEIGKVSKEYDVALATRRIAEAQQADLRRHQLTRQMDLIDDRLGRLKVLSPIDGIIVSGDLQKHIGSPLEQGQTLIEVAPLDQMKLEIEVPEHEISFVSAGNQARVKIGAVGGPSIRMPLSRVHPQSELRDDRNVFVASIDLANADGQLRPGMRGDAVVYGPTRPLIWSWIRGGIERVLWWAGY